MPIDYPNGRIGRECPKCRAKIRVVSAQKLLWGQPARPRHGPVRLLRRLPPAHPRRAACTDQTHQLT